MSFGGPSPHAALGTAVAANWSAGDLMVAAAGNDSLGLNNFVNYPARYSQVIAVSGLGFIPTVRDFNSQYGPEVELSAPFWVSTLFGTSGTALRAGTSFATPAVTGAAALVWTKYPSWSNQQVRTQLRGTAFDLGPAGVDQEFGWGRVDAGAAVGAAAPVQVSILGPSSVRPGDFCSWQVSVGGATGSVTQQWSGALSGTSSFVSGSLFSSGTLSVDVQTSTGQVGDADLFITVSSSAPFCQLESPNTRRA